MVKDVVDCTIPELKPYITGEEFTGKFTGERVSELAIEHMAQYVAESVTATVTLEQCDSYKDFFDIEVDIKKQIDPKDRSNCFYALKNGSYCLQIPPFCQYMIKRAWEAYKIPNLIPKIIPVPVLKEFFKEGYFSAGVTLKDVICNVACQEYTPFSEARYKNNVGGNVELYIESEDMVAMVPRSIGDALDMDTLKRIRKTDYGLAVENILLRTMCGYMGAVNSIYDLRSLI